MRELTLDDQQIFNQYLASSHRHWQFQPEFITIPSAYSFTAHYIWRDFYDFFWMTQNDFFCLFARQDGDYFMPIAPFGSRPLEPEIIEWVFRLMENQSQRTNILRVENIIDVPSRLTGFQIFEAETEYVYCRTKLKDLRGNTYKSKRHSINQFQANYPAAEVAVFQPSDAIDCLALYKEWALNRKKSHAAVKDELVRSMLDDSFYAHRQGLLASDQLGLLGLVVRIDSRLCAYTLGYTLSPSTFCVLFEVANLDYKGLAQFIFHQLCVQRHEKWINVMGDSGFSHLRLVKKSYRPDRLEHCLTIKRSHI